MALEGMEQIQSSGRRMQQAWVRVLGWLQEHGGLFTASAIIGPGTGTGFIFALGNAEGGRSSRVKSQGGKYSNEDFVAALMELVG